MTFCPLVGMGLWGRVCVVFGGRRLWALKGAEYPRVRVMVRPTETELAEADTKAKNLWYPRLDEIEE